MNWKEVVKQTPFRIELIEDYSVNMVLYVDDIISILKLTQKRNKSLYNRVRRWIESEDVKKYLYINKEEYNHNHKDITDNHNKNHK